MKRIEVTDEWLYKYMPIVDETIIRELEDGTDYGYQFSAKFERRMKSILWKEEHPWISAAYRQLKRAAVLGICVAVGLLILTILLTSRFRLTSQKKEWKHTKRCTRRRSGAISMGSISRLPPTV